MTATVRVCSSPTASLEALSEICKWATDLRLAYAWASSSNGHAPHWKALPLEKVTQATIGIHFAQTEPAFLRKMLGNKAFRVIDDTGGVFHPKVIVGIKGGEAKALIGSSNFTNGGFAGNTELNVFIEGLPKASPLSDVVEFLDQQWTHPRAFEPDEEWLQRYEQAFKTRPRPKPVPRKAKAAKVLVSHEADLEIDWQDYYALIEQQERRSLSNGYEIHVFDHPDSSYLQEIEKCQRIFKKTAAFRDIPVEERKFVAGFGGTSGYFGRMVGAGNYKNMIIERPDEIGTLLDAIPVSADPTDAQIVDYLDQATALYGVSFATATRLLIAKRPDRFLSVNGASRGRIQEVFGSAPTTAARYLSLLTRIWSMPWFNSTEPTNRHEHRVWLVRVAILDAVMYDA